MERDLIEINDSSWQCADGCCTWYETLIKVNGVEICKDGGLEDVLKAVLKHFGHEVDVTKTYDYV
jgi:hypothetical protein